MSQAPYPQQPYPPQQQPIKPKKKWYRRPWVWVLAAIVVIAIAVNGNKAGSSTAGSAVSDAPAAQGTAQQAAEQTEKPAAKQTEKTFGMNDAVDAGDLQYTVSKVQNGVSKVGDQYLNQEAQGQYVLVSVTVKNTGKSSTTFDSGLVKLYDKDGAQYSSDSTAEIYANKQASTFLEQINPGNSVKGTLVFDIPKDVQPTQLGVRGGLFGSEKKIALS